MFYMFSGFGFFSMRCPSTLDWCVMEIKGSLDLFLEIRTQTPPKHWRSSSTSVHCSAWHCSSDPSLDHPWSQSTTLSRKSIIFFTPISDSTDNELWREPESMDCNNLQSRSPDEQRKHQKWETTVFLISTSPHLSFCFLLSLIPWVIQHLMPGDSMCNFVSQSLLSPPHAMHSHKPCEHKGALAKMAQLPSQGVREPGRKVCSRSWLPLLAGSAATLSEILALQKLVFSYCQCTLETGEKSTLVMRFWFKKKQN